MIALKRFKRGFAYLLIMCMLISVLPISVAGESSIEITTKSGSALSEAELLDTLVANATDATAYKWQISNGSVWADIDGANTNKFILTADVAGKNVRCVATVGGTDVEGDVITVPTYTIQSTGNGTEKMGSFADTAEVNDQGYRNYSKAEDKFKVDGREFVLLDTFANDESAYFVTSTEAYGDLRSYSSGDHPAPPYVHSNPDSVVSFLNGDFLTQGNTFKALGKNNTTAYKLPSGILNNINKNHIWYRFVNPYFKGEENNKPANIVNETFKAGVSMLSYTDFVNYKSKLGLIDVFSDSNLNTTGAYGSVKANAYFIRDSHTWGGDTAFVTFGRRHVSNNTEFSDDYSVNFWDQAKAPYGLLRPAFYLKSSFFKTTKVDLASAGSNVIAEIKSACTVDELLGLYGAADCQTYLGITGSDINFNFNLKSGKSLENAELLDTLQVNLSGATAYKWQISNNSSWSDIASATANGLILTVDKAGKQVRCIATVGGEEFTSNAFTVPTYTIQSTGTGIQEKMGSFADTAEVNDQGYRNYSKAEDKFKVDGREFVLLDTFANDESAYFVTSTEAYGDLATYSSGDQPSPPFAYSNPDALQPFLDGEFLTQGNTFKALGKNNTTSYKLPTGIVNNINKNHIWYRFVNPYLKGSESNKPATIINETFKAGVSQLSYTDFVNYKNKLGLIDVFSDSNLNTTGAYGSAKANAYFIRDTHTWGGDSAFVTFGRRHVSNNTEFSDDYSVNFWDQGKAKYILLRPAFYLKSSFFKTTKVDLASAGSNVIAEIKSACNTEELLGLYGAEACREYFGLSGSDIAYMSLSLMSGRELADAELLDTIVAKVENITADRYEWEVKNGDVWDVKKDGTDNTFVLTADNAGKTLRCNAYDNDEKVASSTFAIPTGDVMAPYNVAYAPDTSQAYTPATNKFTVGGKGFVLLDSFDNSDSAFYVTTTEAYGDLNIYKVTEQTPESNATQKDMTYDSYRIIKDFLNKDFLTEGNNYTKLGKDTKTYYMLPQGIINNINYDHVWQRWAPQKFIDEKGTLTTYKAGVSLLSWTDFNKYAGKFGIADVFYDSNVNGADAYFISDVNAFTDTSSVTGFKNNGNGQYIVQFMQPHNVKEGYGLVRPAFYLKDSFFKTTKIDFATAGETVMDTLRGRYYVEDLIDVYTEEELIKYGFEKRFSIEAKFTKNGGTEAITSLAGASKVTCSASVRSRADEDTDAVLIMAVYDEGGKIVGINKTDTCLIAKDDTNVEVTVSGLPSGITDKYSATVMLWSDFVTMRSLANSLALGESGNNGTVAASTIKYESDAIGNIFTDVEDAKLRIKSTARNVTYRITDYHNNVVKEETVRPRSNVAELDLKSLGLGYYEIAAQTGETFNNSAEKKLTSFAIIPEYDFSTVKSSPFAVNTHFENRWLGWDIDTIPIMKKAGIKSVRDGYYWGSMEQQKGVYENYWFFNDEQARLRLAGIDYIYTTVGENNLYGEDGKYPYSGDGIKAYAQYCKNAAIKYNHQFGDYKLKYMDAYNEWYVHMDGYTGDHFFNVLKEVYTTVKGACPDVNIFFGMLDSDNAVQNRMFELGILDYCDSVEIHNYNWWDRNHIEDPENPENGLEQSIKKSKAIVDKYNTKNKDLKFWITENGWPSINVPEWGYVITEEEQAEYLVRSYAIAMANGVERMYWYDFMNDRDPDSLYDDKSDGNRRNGERNFGLIRNGFDQTYGAFTPKRSYVTYANMTRELANKNFVNRSEVTKGNGKVYYYNFADGNGAKCAIVCYVVLDGATTDPSTSITLKANETVTVKNIEGRVIKTVQPNQNFTLDVSAEPVYIEGGYSVV